jgi:hypothetical protein
VIYRGPILEAAMGARNRLETKKRNQVGTECGIESPMVHETLILEAKIEVSSIIFAFYFSKCITQTFLHRRSRFLPGLNSMA